MKNRIDYIIKDSGAKLIINDKDIEEICKYDYSNEYKFANFHDLSFIIYTSGTTGNPKGILHEYGKWNEIDEVNAFPYFRKHTNENLELFGMFSPLGFAMSLYYIYAMIFLTIYYDKNKNIVQGIRDNKIKFMKLKI